MKNGAGLFLIIFALFALWAYNTGRAASILAIIKGGPGAQAAGGVATVTTPGGTGTAPVTLPPGALPVTNSGGTVSSAVTCGMGNVASCTNLIYQGVTDPLGTIKNVINAPLSIFGIRL